MATFLDGKAPRSEYGKCFRSNDLWWKPLWEFLGLIAPDLMPKDNGGRFNEAWRLDDASALLLATRLYGHLDKGLVAQYEAVRQAALDALPDEPCENCNYTGEDDEQNMCTCCEGTGLERPWIASSPFSEANVRDFADFLRDCGGFRVSEATKIKTARSAYTQQIYKEE